LQTSENSPDFLERRVGASRPHLYLSHTLPELAGKVEAVRRHDLLQAVGSRVDLAAEQVDLGAARMQRPLVPVGSPRLFGLGVVTTDDTRRTPKRLVRG
jgi:hypothetical protein